MNELRKIYQDFLDMPYYKRVALGQDSVSELKGYFEKVALKIGLKRDNSTIVLLGSLRQFIGADGVFGQDEYDYICDVFELNFYYDAFLEMYNDLFGSYKMINNLRALMSTSPEKVRFAYARLGLLICCSDGELTVDEQKEFEKYLF